MRLLFSVLSRWSPVAPSLCRSKGIGGLTWCSCSSVGRAVALALGLSPVVLPGRGSNAPSTNNRSVAAAIRPNRFTASPFLAFLRSPFSGHVLVYFSTGHRDNPPQQPFKRVLRWVRCPFGVHLDLGSTHGRRRFPRRCRDSFRPSRRWVLQRPSVPCR